MATNINQVVINDPEELQQLLIVTMKYSSIMDLLSLLMINL